MWKDSAYLVGEDEYSHDFNNTYESMLLNKYGYSQAILDDTRNNEWDTENKLRAPIMWRC